MELILGMILVGSILCCALSFIIGIVSEMFDLDISFEMCMGFGIIFLIIVFATGLIGAILYGGKVNA